MSHKLKIALLMQGGRGWLGGMEYTTNLVLALGSLPDEARSAFEIHLISEDPLDDELRNRLAPYVQQFYSHDADLLPSTALNQARWRVQRAILKASNPRLEVLIKQQQLDFIYPYFTAQSKTARYRTAAWIPDFQHKYLPHFFNASQLEQRDQAYACIAQRAEHVVLSSKTAAEDFCKFFPEAAQKALVLSFKSSPSPNWYAGNPQQVQQKYCLPDRFLLISNQFWQHKNHLIVFAALKLLKSRGVMPTVVCTGHIYDYRQPEYSDTILKSIHEAGLAHQVYLLGLIPKLDQVQLLRRSLALIQPSLFEGWSTLVEDARLLGKAMILSDLPVNLEQDPPHSIFFDRTCAEHLAQKIEQFWLEKSPGPDLQAEHQAREQSDTQIQSYGYRFLKIAQGMG
jgi:glycosyltransferase involved in cell wall biosynthesis